jgi:hypothetical protein
MGREEKLLEVLPPLDWDKTGGETWADVVRQVRKVGKTDSHTKVRFTGSREIKPVKKVFVPTFRTCLTTSAQVSPPVLSQSRGGKTSSSFSSLPIRKARS